LLAIWEKGGFYLGTPAIPGLFRKPIKIWIHLMLSLFCKNWFLDAQDAEWTLKRWKLSALQLRGKCNL
jgi:hypothetical protein